MLQGADGRGHTDQGSEHCLRYSRPEQGAARMVQGRVPVKRAWVTSGWQVGVGGHPAGLLCKWVWCEMQQCVF